MKHFRMNLSLSIKIGIFVILTEVFILTVTGYIYIREFSDQVDRRIENQVQLPGRMMDSGLLELDTVSNQDQMELLIGEELVESVVVGANGVVFFSSNPDYTGQQVTDTPIQAALLDSDLDDVKIIQEEDRVISVAPILASDRQTVRFFLYVVAGKAEAEAEKANQVQLFLLGSLATIVATSIIIFLSFKFTIFDRISKILETLRRIEQGDLSVRVPLSPSRDEIGVLQTRVNAMAEKRQQAEIELVHLNEDLEARVEERTTELAAAKRETELALEKALEADQLKSQFLASMSHELRTPLNSILTFSELLEMETFGEVNHEQKDYLQKILFSGRHLLALINDVLDISKIQSGMLKLFIEEDFNVQDELENITASVQKTLEGKPVRLVTDIDREFAPLTCDKRRIRQVLLNLISNAVKFTEEGTITVSAKQRGDEVLFAVTDTGPGIPENQQDVIFEPFFQTETGIKHAGGTGLGLPISKRLIEVHGGRIWLESAPGEGASFFVSLPILPAIKAQEREMEEAT